jgi:hypothetical protein
VFVAGPVGPRLVPSQHAHCRGSRDASVDRCSLDSVAAALCVSLAGALRVCLGLATRGGAGLLKKRLSRNRSARRKWGHLILYQIGRGGMRRHCFLDSADD